MGALIWKTIKDRKLALIIYTAIGVFLVLLYVGLFPSISKQSLDLEQLLKAYPQELMKAFGLSEGFNFSKLENFLATEQYSLTWPILAVALMVSSGGSAIAGEIEKGTIELLLSLPLSRIKLFFVKYLAALSALVIFTIFTVFSVVPFAEAYNVGYNFESYVKAATLGLLFGWTLLSLSIMFSSMFSEKGRAYFVSAGLVVLMYIANVVANLKDNLKDLSYLSFFRYFDTNSALMKNHLDVLPILVFCGSIIVFTIVGMVIFQKRNIAIS